MTSLEKAHEIVKQGGDCIGMACGDSMSPESRCPCFSICDEFVLDMDIDDLEKLCLDKAKQFIADKVGTDNQDSTLALGMIEKKHKDALAERDKAEETGVLGCLLEKIEDCSSDLWDVEVSDLDGSECAVLNVARAKESIIEYAKSYHQRKLIALVSFVADANLYAAAPDMYKALEKAVEEYGTSGGPWNVPSEPGSWIALAKAALAKARGE